MNLLFSASKCPPLPEVEHATANQLAGKGLNYGTVIRLVNLLFEIYFSSNIRFSLAICMASKTVIFKQFSVCRSVLDVFFGFFFFFSQK